MARCFCRWRNVLVCVCTPCICMFLLFTYVAVILTYNMQLRTSGTIGRIPDSAHFVALGLLRSNSSAPLPKTFWEIHQNDGAFWNLLQLTVDRHFNPILRPSNANGKHESGSFSESLLWESFSEVSDSNGVRHNFGKLPQQLQEFVRHMNRREYPVLIEPNRVCGAGEKHEEEPPLLLLAIKSTELNFKNRQAIRQTWGQAGWVAGQRRYSSGSEGKHGAYVRRVFLLGKESTEELGVDVSELLNLENQHYGDILQWEFQDTFFNLTLKDVLFWNWFTRFCNRTLFIFKGDDDVFVNTPVMITYLLDELKKPQAHKAIEDFMIGDVILSAKPNHVNTSKYFVPDTFYKGLYPSYAGGGGVVYSGVLAKRLHNISKRVHLFPIDDVYVGMCMVRINASPVHHPAFLTFDFPKKEEEEQCAYHKILLVHKRSPTQLLQLWADRKRTQTQCWNVPLRVNKKRQK